MRHFLLVLILAGAALGKTVINGNRSITGSWSAAGATSSIPEPSGTSLPGTCTAGMAYFKTDSTGGFQAYRCITTNTWRPTGGLATKSVTLFDPVAGDSGRIQIMFPVAVTVTRVACSVKAATSATINMEERAAATPDTAGTAVLTSDLACDTDQAVSTTFSNATIAANVPVALTIASVSGTPDTLRVFITYTVD
jgi:hypothetical protein